MKKGQYSKKKNWNQVRSDIRDTKFFVKNPKYYHRWKGLGLINKEFKYGHLEPLLEETMLLVVQATIEKIKQPSFLN